MHKILENDVILSVCQVDATRQRQQFSPGQYEPHWRHQMSQEPDFFLKELAFIWLHSKSTGRKLSQDFVQPLNVSWDVWTENYDII